MERNIKIRLMLIGKTQRWVVNELRKAGYKRMDPPYLSAIINGHYHTEYTETVLDKIEEIIKPYENQERSTP